MTLDWTDYAADGHHRIALNLVTKHGRASPLLGKTVSAADLTDRRNEHEDELLLRRLKRLIPEGMRVHVLADRSFGDVKLYELLAHELGFAFTIRFRGCITVETADGADGITKTAAERVPANGVVKILRGAK